RDAGRSVGFRRTQSTLLKAFARLALQGTIAGPPKTRARRVAEASKRGGARTGKSRFSLAPIIGSTHMDLPGLKRKSNADETKSLALLGVLRGGRADAA